MQEWRIGESARLLQLGPGLIPGAGVTCGLNLLLDLRVLRFSSLHKKQHSKFPLDPEVRAIGLSALLLSVTLTK